MVTLATRSCVTTAHFSKHVNHHDNGRRGDDSRYRTHVDIVLRRTEGRNLVKCWDRAAATTALVRAPLNSAGVSLAAGKLNNGLQMC